ncbi:MAG: hypothetical protein HUU10_13775 [Bacteroidetes bacterium]|nr:hypothetical protein [Bacteroidota bacterium]
MRYLFSFSFLIGLLACSSPDKQPEPAAIADSVAVMEADTLSAEIDSVSADVDDILKELE